MMPRASPWLPPPIPGDIERLLERLGDEWAARWIKAPSPCCAALVAGSREDEACLPPSRRTGVHAAPDQLVALGFSITAGQADADNPRDREILLQLGEAAIADLAAALQNASGPNDQLAAVPRRSDAAQYRLSDFASLSLNLMLTADAATFLRCRAAGRGATPTLGTLAAALAGETVRLGCHLGEAQLSAGDVAELAKGDLIVFARGTKEALPLTIEGEVAAGGTIAFDVDEGAIRLRIAEPLNLAMGRL